MSKTMTLRPRISEKAYGLSKTGNTYVIEVPKEANKLTVASAVQVQFDVTVETVNIAVIKGKAKRTYRKGRRAPIGRTRDVKKAYVRLKDGDSINVFPADEVAEETPKAAKKDTK